MCDRAIANWAFKMHLVGYNRRGHLILLLKRNVTDYYSKQNKEKKIFA